jgi:hypothetical protein
METGTYRHLFLPKADRSFWRCGENFGDILRYLAWGGRDFDSQPVPPSRHDGWVCVVIQEGSSELRAASGVPQADGRHVRPDRTGLFRANSLLESDPDHQCFFVGNLPGLGYHQRTALLFPFGLFIVAKEAYRSHGLIQQLGIRTE